MLKVCGVTFDHTTNYGSLFQAWALKTAIEQTGVEGGCEYRLIPIRQMPDYSEKASAADAVYMAFFRILHRSRFRRFERRHFRYADCGSIKELDSLNDETDAFVCGSDVIWNPEFNQGCGAYYLDFARKYAFSYAASFGKASEEDITPQIREWIRRLDDVSCRERSGCDLVGPIIGRTPPVVTDPIFLLKKDRWEKVMAEDTRPLPTHYIFAYNTYMNPDYEAFLKKLSTETSLPVIRATWKLKNALKQKLVTVPTPPRWLKLLANADYVVTNSFHGTGFSILFHRKFFSVVSGTPAHGANVRIWDFLSRLGLEDRIVTGIPDRIDHGEVDYGLADSRLDAFRKESLDYLCRNLEAAYQEKTTSEGR